MNTYAVFAEHFRNTIGTNARAGCIVPTGIATDDTTKTFFADVVEKDLLASLYDFENREALFPGAHRSYKFSLLTFAGDSSRSQFAFFLTNTDQLGEKERLFELTKDDFRRINPNTRTTPVFRTRVDAELTRSIYERVPVLVNEKTGENPWGVRFLRMIDPHGTEWELIPEESEDKTERDNSRLVAVYEGKMFFQYDHRFASVIINPQNIARPAQPEVSTTAEKRNDEFYCNSSVLG